MVVETVLRREPQIREGHTGRGGEQGEDNWRVEF